MPIITFCERKQVQPVSHTYNQEVFYMSETGEKIMKILVELYSHQTGIQYEYKKVEEKEKTEEKTA